MWSIMYALLHSSFFSVLCTPNLHTQTFDQFENDRCDNCIGVPGWEADTHTSANFQGVSPNELMSTPASMERRTAASDNAFIFRPLFFFFRFSPP